MFERFTVSARQVVVLAQEEARQLRHPYIGTEHLLLGLLRVDDEITTSVLQRLGLSIDRVRAEIIKLVNPNAEPTTGQIPFTPRAKKTLELALREALSLGHDYIGSEHILLGLVRDEDSVAAKVLSGFEVDAQRIRTEVIARIPRAQQRSHGSTASVSVSSEPEFTVVPDSDLRRLLREAAARALANGRDEFGLADLLAVSDDESDPPAAA